METTLPSHLFLTPLLRKILPCLTDCWLVGGFVRDSVAKFKGKEVLDVDVLCKSDERIVNCFKDLKLNFSVFRFKKNGRKITRIASSEFTVDVALVENLESDLKERDFTVNAIAVKCSSLLTPKAVVVDLHGGLKDIENKVIRPIEGSLIKDPLRILRGIRLKVEKNFNYHESFLLNLNLTSPMLSSIPGERIKEEVFKVWSSGKFVEFLKEVLTLGIWKHTFGSECISVSPEVVSVLKDFKLSFSFLFLKENPETAFRKCISFGLGKETANSVRKVSAFVSLALRLYDLFVSGKLEKKHVFKIVKNFGEKEYLLLLAFLKFYGLKKSEEFVEFLKEKSKELITVDGEEVKRILGIDKPSPVVGRVKNVMEFLLFSEGKSCKG